MNLDRFKLTLSKNSAERCLAVGVGFWICVFLGVVGYSLHQWQPTASDGLERWALAVAVEIFFTLTLFCVLGVLWAISTPRWLEELLQTAYGKVKLVCTVSIAGICFTAVYLLAAH